MPYRRDGGMSDFRDSIYSLERVNLPEYEQNVILRLERHVLDGGFLRYGCHYYNFYPASALRAYLAELSEAGTWFLEGHDDPFPQPDAVEPHPFFKVWEPLGRYR